MSEFPPIFVVDDDEVDIEILSRFMEREGLGNPLYTACDGVEALAMLNGRDGEARVPQPCLALVDINMPRMNGLEFLNALVQNPHLNQKFVFVLSTSVREEDLRAAFALNVAGYILKDRMNDLPGLIRHFLQLCEFPRPHGQESAQ